MTTGRSAVGAEADGSDGGVVPPPRLPWLRDHGPVLAVVVPWAVLLVIALTSDWLPSGDIALEALHVDEVGTSHTPLVGVYSRFGWSHPGPLLFWLGAPFVSVLGPRGLLVEAAVVGLVSAVVAVVAARRVGGLATAWLVAGCVLAGAGASGATTVLDPWNPFMAWLPLLAFLLCAAATAEGSRPFVLVAAVAGSFTVQSHVGSAPVVAAATVAAGLWAWARHRAPAPDAAPRGEEPAPRAPTDGGGRAWPWAVATVALLLVLWSGPLVDQVTNDPGNLSELVDFALHGEEPATPLDVAVGVGARELGPAPAWLVGRETVAETAFVDEAAPWTLAVVVVALGAAGAWAWRRRDGTALRLVAYASVTWVVGVVALTRNIGFFTPYLVRWTWPVGMLVAAAVGTAVWRGVDRGPRARGTAASVRRVAGPVAVGLVLVASVAVTGRALVAGSEPRPAQSEAIEGLTDAITDALPEGAYAFRWSDGYDLGSVPIGVAVELVRQGWDLRLPEADPLLFDERRTDGGDDRPQISILASRAGSRGSLPEAARLVATSDALTPEERSRLTVLEERIRADADVPSGEPVVVDSLVTADVLAEQGADHDDAVEALHLQREGDTYEVWLIPPGASR